MACYSPITYYLKEIIMELCFLKGIYESEYPKHAEELFHYI